MRIIILGAGKVGYQIAESLSNEEYDIVVIDNDEIAIFRVQENLDVLAIHANGFTATPLKELEINGKDIFIAVTDSDEGNMLACMSAKNLGCGRTIARVRKPEYAKDLAITKEQLAIDLTINPDHSTAAEIARLLTFSPAGQSEQLAQGRVQMAELPVESDNPLIGVPLRDAKQFKNMLIAAILREGEVIIPRGEDVIKQGDDIYLVGKKQDIVEFSKYIGKKPRKARSITIVGGGRTASYLADILHRLGIQVKLIEIDSQKAKRLSEELPHTLVIEGDGTDVDLLRAENIPSMDALIALTGIDEINILLSLLAKQMGTRKTVAKVNRINYIPLVEEIGIDALVTPSVITAGEILRFVRGGSILSLFLLSGGQAEIMEFYLQETSKIIGVPIKDLKLPKDSIITTIVSGDSVTIPGGNDTFKAHDRVIVICKSSEVEKIKNVFIDKDIEGKVKDGLWNNIKNTRPFITR